MERNLFAHQAPSSSLLSWLACCLFQSWDINWFSLHRCCLTLNFSNISVYLPASLFCCLPLSHVHSICLKSTFRSHHLDVITGNVQSTERLSVEQNSTNKPQQQIVRIWVEQWTYLENVGHQICGLHFPNRWLVQKKTTIKPSSNVLNLISYFMSILTVSFLDWRNLLTTLVHWYKKQTTIMWEYLLFTAFVLSVTMGFLPHSKDL